MGNGLNIYDLQIARVLVDTRHFSLSAGALAIHEINFFADDNPHDATQVMVFRVFELEKSAFDQRAIEIKSISGHLFFPLLASKESLGDTELVGRFLKGCFLTNPVSGVLLNF